MTSIEKSNYLLETMELDNFLFYIYDRTINHSFKIQKIVETKHFFDRLLLKYTDPVAISVDNEKIPRCYHDINHIAEGVRDLVDIEQDFKSINLVLIAWFYHDSHYLVGSNSDNEKMSADYSLMDLIRMGWSGEKAGKVYDLIMWTKHKENPPENDYEANLIVDVDLLRASASPFEAFSLSTEMLRKEFSIYSEEDWSKGRLKFWEDFLKMKNGRIFRTSHFSHLNEIALDNINKSIELLKTNNRIL